MPNPYQNLKTAASNFANKVFSRKRKSGGYYPKSDLRTTGFDLLELYNHTNAAKAIGYDTQVEVTDKGLEVVYVEQLPKRPYEF